MKKSKIIALTALSVILCLMLMCTSSFSWFTRGTQTGGYFKWSNNDSETALSYNTSNGANITMATYSSPDGKTYGENTATSFSESSGISAGDRKYYRTDITNSGDTDQSVSLYLSNLQTGESGSFYLGVNSPLKTYKNYSFNTTGANKTMSAVNKKNVYVGFNVNQTYTPSDYRLHYVTSSGSSGDAVVGSSYIGKRNYTASSYNNYKADYNIAVATVPYNTNTVKLKYSTGYDGYGDAYTITDTLNTVILFHYDSGYHSAHVVSGKSASINTYYSEAFVGIGESTNISAVGVWSSVSYKSSNTDIVSVDSNGEITGVSAGSATVTVTAKGAYGDTITADCVVTVEEQSKEVPIITNLYIPAKSGDMDSVVSVYWYIKNDSESGDLTYTVDDLYISL